MSKSTFKHARVVGITGVVPEKCITIDDEIQFYGGDAKKLNRNKAILGLGSRHVVDDKTSLSDLCLAAAENLISGMQLDRSKIDTLIVASTSHDYHCPATASVLHGKLNLDGECACYDQSGLGCTAYVHAIWQAHALVESGASKCCLLLAGDIGSRHSDRLDRNVNMLFGDAVTATLIEYTEEEINSYFYLGSDGKGWKNIVAPAGGYNLPVLEDIANLAIKDDDGNVWHPWNDILKGMSVFKFSSVAGPNSINRVLELAKMNIDDVCYFALHQANKQIIRTVAGYAGLPKDKFSWETFSQYGNCASTAVAMEVVRALSLGTRGNYCLATFGVGLSWGSAVLNLSDIWTGGITTYKTPSTALSRKERIQKWIEYYQTGNDFEAE